MQKALMLKGGIDKQQKYKFDFLNQFSMRHSWIFGEKLEYIYKAHVLIVGVGGIGSSVAYFLARYGVGHITLIDPDVVEPHNLNRQYFFYEDIGIPKVFAVKKLLKNINPFICVDVYQKKLQDIPRDRLHKLVREATLIVDAMDEHIAKIYLNRMAEKMKKIVIHAHSCGFKSTITVFMPGGPYYEETFGIPTRHIPMSKISSRDVDRYIKFAVRKICSGVLPKVTVEKIVKGEIPMQISVPPTTIGGVIVSTEAIKIIIGRDELVIRAPRMLLIDPWRHEYKVINIRPFSNIQER